MKLENKTIEVQRENGISLKLYVRKLENSKNPIMLGFVSLAVEKDGKFLSSYNNFSILEGNKGVFVKEPGDRREVKGEWKEYPHFIATSDIKNDIVSILKQNFN